MYQLIWKDLLNMFQQQFQEEIDPEVARAQLINLHWDRSKERVAFDPRLWQMKTTQRIYELGGKWAWKRGTIVAGMTAEGQE